MSEPFITTARDDSNSSSSLGADDEACSNVLTGTDQAEKTCSEFHKLEVLKTVNRVLAGELSEVQNELEIKESKNRPTCSQIKQI